MAELISLGPCRVSGLLTGTNGHAVGSSGGRPAFKAGLSRTLQRHCLEMEDFGSKVQLHRRKPELLLAPHKHPHAYRTSQGNARWGLCAVGQAPTSSESWLCPTDLSVHVTMCGMVLDSAKCRKPAPMRLTVLPLLLLTTTCACALQVCGGNAGDLRRLAAEVDSKGGDWDAGEHVFSAKAATL